MLKDSDFELCMTGNCPIREFKLVSEAMGGAGI